MSQIARHLYTLFLFTKADLSCALPSVVVFALATTYPTTSFLSSLIHASSWAWLHLLQLTVANQCKDPSEDALNNPHRPIPSGRITPDHAYTLRWALAPICLVYSKILYGDEVAYASAAVAVLLFMYNELGGDSHWSTRDFVNAGLFAMFEAGAALVASDNRHSLDDATVKAICVNAFLYATTNFSQDFKDVVGDALVGRRTLPIVFPTFSRIFLLPVLFGWSIALAALWRIEPAFATPFVVVAVLIGWRYLVSRSASKDKETSHIYLGWLSVAHLLPAYYRITSSSV